MNDSLKKYLTTDHSTRIQTVRLAQSWQTGLAHQTLPTPVTRLLGELSAACVLLASNIKFDGSVVLQLQGNGPIRLILVECTADLGLRATASLATDAQIPDLADLQVLMNADGQGRFTVMLDPADRSGPTDLYRGIVPLEGSTVAAALESYMKHSEQLDTRLWLAADGQACAGVLLQRMPENADSGHTPETSITWEHCVTLASTLKSDELLKDDPDTVTHRLFWQDDLLAFPDQPVRWHCSCTRQRVADMLRALGKPEVDDILAEQGHVHVDCHFCGKPYEFDAVDCAMLFIDETTQREAPGSGSVH